MCSILKVLESRAKAQRDMEAELVWWCDWAAIKGYYKRRGIPFPNMLGEVLLDR